MKRLIVATLLAALLPLPGMAADGRWGPERRTENDEPSGVSPKEARRNYAPAGATLLVGGLVATAYGFTCEQRTDAVGDRVPGRSPTCSPDGGRKAARVAGIGVAATGASLLIFSLAGGRTRDRRGGSPSIALVPGLRSGTLLVSF